MNVHEGKDWGWGAGKLKSFAGNVICLDGKKAPLSLIFHVTKERLWLMVPCVAAGLQGWDWWALSGSRQCNDSGVNFLFSLWRGFCFPGEGLDLQHSTSGAPGEPGGWRGWGCLWRFWKGFQLLGLDWEKVEEKQVSWKEKKGNKSNQEHYSLSFFSGCFTCLNVFVWLGFFLKRNTKTLLMSCWAEQTGASWLDKVIVFCSGSDRVRVTRCWMGRRHEGQEALGHRAPVTALWIEGDVTGVGLFSRILHI